MNMVDGVSSIDTNGSEELISIVKYCCISGIESSFIITDTQYGLEALDI